eukprot:SAG22_NODE_1086_length_5629_cov_2.137251_1_plen_63_part_10
MEAQQKDSALQLTSDGSGSAVTIAVVLKRLQCSDFWCGSRQPQSSDHETPSPVTAEQRGKALS